jgi:hypothetical protein
VSLKRGLAFFTPLFLIGRTGRTGRTGTSKPTQLSL